MKDRKYVVALIALVIVYVFLEMRKGESLDWTASFHNRHSIPFGTMATHDLMKDMLSDSAVESSYETVYEIATEGEERNLLILAERIAFSDDELEKLLDYVNRGKTVIIGGKEFLGGLRDSLEFTPLVTDPLLTYDLEAIQENLAGESKQLITTDLGGVAKSYSFSSVATTSAILSYNEDNFNVLAKNEAEQPVLLEYKGSKGRLILTTMPLALTNYFVLNEETTSFASSVLSLFPEDEPVLHVEYYQLGRLESQTPLRVVLANRSLRWGMFILLFTLLIFIFFESKRRQRIIPLIDPMKNLSVEFVETLGRLYYRQKDHRKLATKRVTYWKDFVRRKYNLRTDNLSNQFTEDLAKKSGLDIKEIELLLVSINHVEAGNEISLEELMLMEKQLNAFYGIE
ncbi:DUF4350 domain-containing protein [Roseivirga misakiensis]|uniref:DUF4350 domain-containing protein n=1 Tax=Roseivirga misakiensis TaxID=1563681 RepID=A0A1E5T3K1_9BACT|nr:DUF4350 domain-containing protein [Roseivirga misakiensis]OEK05950.1 hypothetical protein BFP71_07510 [Roseivirga misakiensis]